MVIYSQVTSLPQASRIDWLLKGQSTDCTHEGQFDRHRETNSAGENSRHQGYLGFDLEMINS